MEPEDYWRESNRLLNSRGKEADEVRYRSAIRAAYYAVFHLARRRLNIKTDDKKNRGHKAVMKALDEYKGSDRGLRAARQFFKNMMLARFDADYELSARVTKDQAHIAERRAYIVMKKAGLL